MLARQTAAVLAALRLYQQQGGSAPAAIQEIASDGGGVEPLTAGEIDALCAEINAAPEITTVVVEINGGAIYCARSDAPVRVVILDHDTEGGDEEEVKKVGEDEFCVSRLLLDEQAEHYGSDGIDAEYVANILKEI